MRGVALLFNFMNSKSNIKIAFLGTYTPRQCGIATYSKSLVEIIGQLYVEDPISIIAVSDEIGAYKYPKEVVFEIDQYNQKSYIKAAEYVNNSEIEVVNLQHEYGIFGGEDGAYIVNFLENLNKPVITTLHSVLRLHSPHRKELSQKIIDLSEVIVVMTDNAKKILLEIFEVTSEKIKVIRHGVPNVRFDDKEKVKEKLQLKGRLIFSTFGLINRGKGIEYALGAIKDIVKEHPETLYLIIGITHPAIIKREGETYRKMLEKLVLKYGLSNNVKFINKFLDYSQLVDYLVATDIYLSPQQDFNQSFSGTVSYAMGCGCAVISSPTAYALEILANNRGVIAKPKSIMIKKSIKKVLENGNLGRYQLRSYNFARSMIWSVVGLKKVSLMEQQIYVENKKWLNRLPNYSKKPNISYLEKITTDLGIVQHAIKSKPDFRFGYSLDDQARALIAVAKYGELFGKDKKINNYIDIYLKYLEIAIDKNGVIHNFINKHGKIIDEFASDDSISRAFWSLSYIIGLKDIDEKTRTKAKKLHQIYEKRLLNNYLRPIAFNLLGYALTKNKAQVEKLAKNLISRFNENNEESWSWFEEELTWGNAIIPYSLIKAYRFTGKINYLKTAVRAAEFLNKVTTRKGVPAPIGQEEWYFKNYRKAIYDQQPIEAGDMVLLFNELFFATGEKKYRERAQNWMGWFFGNNINETIMYDDISHGVMDGLGRTGPNKNQGAESIVIYLLAYLSFSGDDQML